jgi:hypothetical protein
MKLYDIDDMRSLPSTHIRAALRGPPLAAT